MRFLTRATAAVSSGLSCWAEAAGVAAGAGAAASKAPAKAAVAAAAGGAAAGAAAIGYKKQKQSNSETKRTKVMSKQSVVTEPR